MLSYHFTFPYLSQAEMYETNFVDCYVTRKRHVPMLLYLKYQEVKE